MSQTDDLFSGNGAVGKKKKKKTKTKTVSLNEFIGDSLPPPTAVQLDLPSAPRSSAGIDLESMDIRPPYTAFVGNLAYETEAADIEEFFTTRNCAVTNVRVPKDHDSDRIKGFGYAEFKTLHDLSNAIAASGELLLNRPVRVDLASGNQDGGRDGDREGRGDRYAPLRSDTIDNWRTARDDGPPGGGGGGGFDRGGDRYGGGGDRYGDRGGGRYGDRGGGGFGDRGGGYNDRGGGYGDRGGGGYGRDRGGYGDRGGGYGDRGGDRGGGYGDRGGGDRDGYDRGGDRYGSRGYGDSYRGGYGDRGGYNDRGGGYDRGGDRYGNRGYGHSYRGGDRGGDSWRREGPPAAEPGRERPRLNLSKRSDAAPAKEDSAAGSDKPSPFGGARPVDTAKKLAEVDEKLSAKASPPKPKPAAGPKSNPFGNAKPVDTQKKLLEIDAKLEKTKKPEKPATADAEDIGDGPVVAASSALDHPGEAKPATDAAVINKFAALAVEGEDED